MTAHTWWLWGFAPADVAALTAEQRKAVIAGLNTPRFKRITQAFGGDHA